MARVSEERRRLDERLTRDDGRWTADERFLGRVLCAGPVADQAVCQAVNVPLIPRHKFAVRFLPAAERAPEQVAATRLRRIAHSGRISSLAEHDCRNRPDERYDIVNPGGRMVA